MAIITVNMIKSHGLCNLNRDRYGMPKTVSYGGKDRGDQTTQNQEYNIRQNDLFREMLVDREDGSVFDPLCTRTRRLADAIAGIDGAAQLFSDWNSDDVDFQTELAFLIDTKEPNIYSLDELTAMLADIRTWLETSFKNKDELYEFFAWCRKECVTSEGRFNDFKKSNDKTSSKKDDKPLTDQQKKWVEDFKKAKKNIKSRIGTGITLDIALFGRMVADNQTKRVDGAVHMAHALTTHAVSIGTDFFSVVDDLDKNGAAHLDDAGYVTGVFHHFLGINVDLLKRSMKGYDPNSQSIDEVIKTLITLAAFTSSSSKQKSMASSPFPSLVYIEKYPTNHEFTYETAFENPVVNEGQGFEIPSILRFKREVETMASTYDIFKPERFWLCPRGIELDPTVGTNCRTFSELLSHL